MKYVLSKYKCKCGQEITYRVDLQLVKNAKEQSFDQICPFCAYKNDISVTLSLPVMCYKHTNKPKVFDTKDEESYQNAILN